MKDFTIKNNKYVEMRFYNFHIAGTVIRCNIEISLHSYYNPFESMLFRFRYNYVSIIDLDGVIYHSVYRYCRNFYEKTLQRFDMYRKAKTYKEQLSRLIVNTNNIEVLSPIKVYADFETKY